VRWLLPEHVEDVLPAEAAKIEALRRALLDLFASHGYELVIPPLLEYVDSLLTGTGHDLDLRTFKLVDQLSGKMMGVRADITPQVAPRTPVTMAASQPCSVWPRPKARLVISTPIAANTNMVVGSATTWPTICSRCRRR